MACLSRSWFVFSRGRKQTDSDANDSRKCYKQCMKETSARKVTNVQQNNMFPASELDKAFATFRLVSFGVNSNSAVLKTVHLSK